MKAILMIPVEMTLARTHVTARYKPSIVKTMSDSVTDIVREECVGDDCVCVVVVERWTTLKPAEEAIINKKFAFAEDLMIPHIRSCMFCELGFFACGYTKALMNLSPDFVHKVWEKHHHVSTTRFC